MTLGGPDGNAVIGLTATDKAMDVVSKVNAAGTGVTASTNVEATISNFQSTDEGKTWVKRVLMPLSIMVN
ncbi:MAG: hypothetical protein LC639_02650 [Idiomarina sp.]|nr:hypothetical protein [Idiomarina sp.]